MGRQFHTQCSLQAAVFNELAKIEVQQRVVIQQINALKSERCASRHAYIEPPQLSTSGVILNVLVRKCCQ